MKLIEGPAFLWVFGAAVMLVIIVRSWNDDRFTAKQLGGGAFLMITVAIATGYAFEGARPLDVVLLRKPADIYTVFMMSVGYAMIVIAAIRILRTRLKA
jgi:hypothetical protein